MLKTQKLPRLLALKKPLKTKKLFYKASIVLFFSFLLPISIEANPRSQMRKVHPTEPSSHQQFERNNQRVLLGIDVLEKNDFRDLKHKKVGLLTHGAGVNGKGTRTIDVLSQNPRVNLVALYSPEHGLDSKLKAEAYVHHGSDKKTQLPIYSLHGETRRPTHAMLKDIDTMVVDLQDLGVRSYSYISCLRYTIEECFRYGIEVIILDRPNPLGGYKVDGPIIDTELIGYGGAYPIPYVYGLTIGELALMAKKEKNWLQIDPKLVRKGKLKIIKMEGWTRDMLWPDTGLTWVATSPNIPDLSAVMGYPITGLGAEIGGLDHGIGTPYPFRFLRFPDKSPKELEEALRQRNMPGIDFKRITLPNNVEGVYIIVKDWSQIHPTEISFHIMQLACQWSSKNPFAEASKSKLALFKAFMGCGAWLNELVTRGAMARVSMFIQEWEREAKAFQEKSAHYWLYN